MPPAPTQQDDSTTPPVAVPLPEKLRSVESRFLLPLAGVGFVAVLVLAWYGVVIVNKPAVRDDKLTFREADFLVRSKRLIGLSLEEAQPLLEGEIISIDGSPPKPAVQLADRENAMLVMELEAGRVKSAAIKK
jgi:hypothetical protein